MKTRSSCRNAARLQSFALLCLGWFWCATVRADSRIQFGGVPVELAISPVSDRTLRIELSPLDAQSRVQTGAPSPVLVAFPTTEKFRARELSREKQLRVGQFRVTE